MAERDDDNRWRAYDEAVRSGPALADVATGDYRPSDLTLAHAATADYGPPDVNERWGRDSYFGSERRLRRGAGSDYAPVYGVPPDFGRAGGAFDRIGGWKHGDTGLQRRRGPKGYKRSDDRIREDICEHLMNIGRIDSSDVEVSVRDGRVTLTGTVPVRHMKHEIEDIAAQTLGVDDVENNVRVPRADEAR